MNKLYIYLIALIGMFTTTACDDENYQLYDANETNKIYFEYDSVIFVYGAREDKACDVRIPIKLIGLANLEKDVPFKIEIDNYESTAKEGVHYHLADQQVFMKDSTMAYIDIDFDKSALVKDVNYSIILRLGSNDSYVPANTKKCVVIFGDTYIEQPAWWLPDRLGTYTQEKLVMFIQYFHATKDLTPVLYDAIVLKWGLYLDTPQEGFSRFPYLLTTYTYTTYFKQYCYTPMYEYYLKTGDKRYEMPDPALLP